MLKRILTAALLLTVICSSIEVKDAMHNFYMYNKGRETVYRILDLEKSGGGTGSNIDIDGKEYLITNAHVCHEDSGFKIAMNEATGQEHIVSILAVYGESDLCILEGIEGAPTLEIASSSWDLQKIYVLGHPGLDTLRVSEGYLTSRTILELPYEYSKERCEAYGGYRTISVGWTIEVVCVIGIDSYTSHAFIRPGSSGSPVVNQLGHIVAFAFAGNFRSGTSYFVSLEAIKETLTKFRESLKFQEESQLTQ